MMEYIQSVRDYMSTTQFQDVNFTCELCSRKYFSEKKFKSHLENHHKSDAMASDTVSTNIKLVFSENHKIQETKKPNYSIRNESASKKFEILVSKQDNSDTGNTKNVRLKCSLCEDSIISESDFQDHAVLFHKMLKVEYQIEYYCDICNQTFGEASSFKKHIILGGCKPIFLKAKEPQQHPSAADSVPEISIVDADQNSDSLKTKPKKSKTLHCPKCYKGFYKQNILQKHIEESHGPTRSFPCSMCDKKYCFEQQLKVHNSVAHYTKLDQQSNFTKSTNELKKEVDTLSPKSGSPKIVSIQPNKSNLWATELFNVEDVNARDKLKIETMQVPNEYNPQQVPSDQNILANNTTKRTSFQMTSARHISESDKMIVEAPKLQNMFDTKHLTTDRDLLTKDTAKQNSKLITSASNLPSASSSEDIPLARLPKKVRANQTKNSMESKFKFVCPICALRYITHFHLKTHFQSVHENSSMPVQKPSVKLHKVSDEGKFKCPICAVGFARADGVRRHIQNVHEKLHSYSCDVCEKEYVGKQRLRDHMEKKH